MKYFKNTLVICALSTVPSAFAQDVASSVRSEANPRLKRTSVEIRPIESLVSATPGLASGGASIETYIGRNWGLNVGGSYADVDLPQKYVGSVNEEIDQPMVDRGYGYTAGAGLRYYDDPIGDSVYGGMNIDYSESRVGWEYNGETYNTAQIAVTPSVSAGYRWVWQSGFLARVGAGVGLPSVTSQKVVNETAGAQAQAGRTKIENALNERVVAKLDMGLGMMF